MNIYEVVADLNLTRRGRQKKAWKPFMRKYGCNIVCEIGVQRGINFRKMIEHRPKLAVAIDSWKDDNVPTRNDGGFSQETLDEQYEEFIKNNNKPLVKVIRDYSFNAVKEFPNEFFDLIYVDGDHSYEGCLQDLNDWYPKVKKGKFLPITLSRLGDY